jgi:regulator of protease activity HflC (stomatin/prohibitin superfamily)
MTNFSVLSSVGLFLLVALVLYVAYITTQRSQGNARAKLSVSIIAILALGGIALNLMGAGLTFIQPQERAMVLSAISPTGYRPDALPPGVHFVVPFLETPRRISVAQQAYTMSKTPAEGQVKGDDSVSARTADGQEVFIDATVQFQADEAKVTELFIKWQDRYLDEFVRPQSRSIIYNRVAQYKVEEVYSTRRDELASKISEELKTVFARDGLRLTSFLLRNVTFSPEYAKSVEEKQIAQQNAERAKFLVQSEEQEAARVRVQAQGQADAVVTRAKADADAQVINAEAESKSLGLISNALKDNPSLLTYRYIEKLSPSIQTILLPSGQNFILDPKSLLEATGPVTTTK